MIFDGMLINRLELDDKDMEILELIDQELESTLENMDMMELQTVDNVTEALTREINRQEKRISMLVEMASPKLQEYIMAHIDLLKENFLN